MTKECKSTVLYAGRSTPHVGWLAVDEFAELLAYYMDSDLESPLPIQGNRVSNKIWGRDRFETTLSVYGDVLIIVARAPSDLNMLRSVVQYRSRFKKIYGIVTDSYFREGYPTTTSEFDALFVTSIDDIQFVRDKFKIDVFHMYQGIDTLRWAPKGNADRCIDVVGFGRIPVAYHSNFVSSFHRPCSPYLYLHSPLGNVIGNSIGIERGMLFKILQRSKLSLAFNLFVGASGDRPISMMVTSRWLESLLSGCIVVGKKPISKMSDDMLSWSGATIELSNDPILAVDELVSIIENNREYESQRQINTHNIIERHDWRYRIRDLAETLNFELNEKFSVDFESLSQLQPK